MSVSVPPSPRTMRSNCRTRLSATAASMRVLPTSYNRLYDYRRRRKASSALPEAGAQGGAVDLQRDGARKRVGDREAHGHLIGEQVLAREDLELGRAGRLRTGAQLNDRHRHLAEPLVGHA